MSLNAMIAGTASKKGAPRAAAARPNQQWPHARGSAMNLTSDRNNHRSKIHLYVSIYGEIQRVHQQNIQLLWINNCLRKGWGIFYLIRKRALPSFKLSK